MTKNNSGPKPKVIFMGTTALSATILAKLISEEYDFVGVFTKPDMKVGRKHELIQSPVKILAEKNNLPIFQPHKFRAEGLEELKNILPDLIVVAAYGKILPGEALNIPKLGCINVHVSLLPKYRGASPVQNAILEGETETGVTIMLMDEGIDTGDILSQEKVSIAKDDTTEILMAKLAEVGAELLAKTLPAWIAGKITPLKQDHSQATHCKMLEREDGHVLWKNTSQKIYDQYRALSPWPGIFANWKNGADTFRIKLIAISISAGGPEKKYAVGEVFKFEEKIGVQSHSGVMLLQEIQRDGKAVMSAKAFANGHSNFIGSILY